MRTTGLMVAAALWTGLVAPVTAQVAPQQTADSAAAKAGKKDPSRVVCRMMDTTGSRLNRKRECRTAAEWAEQSVLDRREIERTQANRWRGE